MKAERTRAIARRIGVCAFAALATASARPATQGQSVLDQFDFRQKEATHAKLPRALQEVSGLAVAPDGRVFAHADERGVVVQVDACAAKITKSFALGTPPVRGDFEGIAIAGERFFLITSTGHLYEFREGADGGAVPFTVRDTGFGRICELEGLAYDPGGRVLVVGCKQSARPELRGQVAVLRWALDRAAPATPPSLTIPLAEVVKKLGGKGFHTSSIERDARSGNYILVSGPERSLLEVTAKGAVVATRPLQRQLHSQPESITFLGDSVLVIADEGGTGDGRASVTCYHRVR